MRGLKTHWEWISHTHTDMNVLKKLIGLQWNTNILNDLCKYEYKYEYFSHTKPKINMFVHEKAIKWKQPNIQMCYKS